MRITWEFESPLGYWKSLETASGWLSRLGLISPVRLVRIQVSPLMVVRSGTQFWQSGQVESLVNVCGFDPRPDYLQSLGLPARRLHDTEETTGSIPVGTNDGDE